MNPFYVHPLNMTGPKFLAFYFTSLFFAFLFYLSYRALRALLGKWTTQHHDGDSPPLDQYELAYLSAGADRAATSTMAVLVHDGSLSVSEDKQLTRTADNDYIVVANGVYRGSPKAKPRHWMEKYLLEFISQKRGSHPARKVRWAMRRHARALSQRLVDMRLIVPTWQFALHWLLAKGPLWGLFALGGYKFVIGAQRDRPILILLMLLFASATIIWRLPRPSRRTARGDRVLKSLQEQHAALGLTARTQGTQLTTPDVAMAMALFGPALLTDVAPVQDLLVSLKRPECWSACGSGSGCGSGGGCGGGCGGCGGCGGG